MSVTQKEIDAVLRGWKSDGLAYTGAEMVALAERIEREGIAPSDGYAIVPIEPDTALLASMATCQNHGFGIMPYEHQQHMLYEMRKLYDEVVGRGWYSPENSGRYEAMLAEPPKQEAKPNVSVGTIGHIDHSKTSLMAVILKANTTKE